MFVKDAFSVLEEWALLNYIILHQNLLILYYRLGVDNFISCEFYQLFIIHATIQITVVVFIKKHC